MKFRMTRVAAFSLLYPPEGALSERHAAIIERVVSVNRGAGRRIWLWPKLCLHGLPLATWAGGRPVLGQNRLGFAATTARRSLAVNSRRSSKTARRRPCP